MTPIIEFDHVTEQALNLPLLQKIKLVERLMKHLTLEITPILPQSPAISDETIRSAWDGLLELAENAPPGKFTDVSINHDQYLYPHQ